uniref:Uncharacterized protein n=1 Tax=Arundo donax TaxID=35708 RepID=A0A0A9BQF0_ARUDO
MLLDSLFMLLSSFNDVPTGVSQGLLFSK